MNNENINIPEEDFNEGLEDIEQLLKPQCEFKASDSLKEEVLAQAREEIKPRRKVNLWPWVAAACVVGFALLWFTPPEEKKSDAALHAYLVRAYDMEHAKTVCVSSSDRMDTYESFESIERRMRSKGEALKANDQPMTSYNN